MTGDEAAGLTPRTAGALAFVDDVASPALSTDDAHHLRRVLRLRDGATVAVSDGTGRWRVCRLGDELDPVGAVVVEPEPGPELTVAFSIPKGERPEVAVQKLTELGVDRIVLLATERTIVRWDGCPGRRHLERLERVAREAAMQCRRPRLPEIAARCPSPPRPPGPAVARCDAGGAPVSLAHPCVLVGPEGGWTEAERDLPLPSVALAPHVLRVETAAIAAGGGCSARLRSQLVAL